MKSYLDSEQKQYAWCKVEKALVKWLDISDMRKERLSNGAIDPFETSVKAFQLEAQDRTALRGEPRERSRE